MANAALTPPLMKQIAAAMLMYMGDYDETFPYVLDCSANFTDGSVNMGDNGKSPMRTA